MSVPYALKVALGFAQLPDTELNGFASGVVGKLYLQPVFTDPPVDKASVELAITKFGDAIAASLDGGPSSTAAKNNARDALIGVLKELAGYVQRVSNNDLEVLLSSGFKAASRNRTQIVLPAPVLKAIKFGQSGELLVTVFPVATARGYEAETAEAVDETTLGPWVDQGFFTSSRNMRIGGMTPGKTYVVRVRAMGGLTKKSDWSAPSSHMVV